MLFNLILWLLGWILFFKPKVVPQSLKCSSSSEISVIIPARNEEENIEGVLKSLKEQTEMIYEIIVVDDNSSDKTAEIARRMGAKVIQLKEDPPPGWQGKSWACWNGFLNSKGKIIVFIDADVRLAPDALKNLVCLYKEKRGLISVWPYHKIGKLRESLSFVFNLVALFPMRVSGILKNFAKPMGAFGPCIVTSREEYNESGGHASVKDSVVEDVMLGKLYLKNGVPVNNYLGWKQVSFRMYPKGVKSIFEGWGKNIALGLSLIDFISFFFLFFWLTGVISAGFFLNLKKTGTWASVSLYCLYSIQIYAISKKVGSFGVIPPLFFPLYFLFFMLIFAFSFFQTYILKRIVWKGRRIKID